MVQPGETLSPDLQSLVNEGAALDAAALPPPMDETGAPVAPVNFSDEAATLVDLIAGTLQAVFPYVEIAPATRGRLAGAWAPVLEKYDVTGSGLFGQYSAEIGAAIVTVPVVLQIRSAIKNHRQQPDERQKADAALDKFNFPYGNPTETPSGEHLPL